MNIYLIYDKVKSSDGYGNFEVFSPIACFLVEKTAKECLRLIHDAFAELTQHQGNSASIVLKELYHLSASSSTATLVEIEVNDIVDDDLGAEENRETVIME